MEAPRRDNEWVIGIDVGGTKIAAAAVDSRNGAVAFRRETPTRPERGGAAVLADIEGLAEAISQNLREDGRWASAIGIGMPELVDGEGSICSGHLLDWSAVPISERLASIAPTFIESDVRAAALAEARYGAGAAYALFTFVSVGTGISSSIVLDGVPLVGARGGALVLSSGAISVPCAACGAWSAFVLEDYASGPALARRYAASTGRDVGSAEAVTAAADAGDPAAIEIVDAAARALGSAIGWLVDVVDPEAVVISGGLGLAGGRFWDRLVHATRAHVWNDAARELSIVPAGLGPNAGIIGAAAAARFNPRATTASWNAVQTTRRLTKGGTAEWIATAP